MKCYIMLIIIALTSFASVNAKEFTGAIFIGDWYVAIPIEKANVNRLVSDFESAGMEFMHGGNALDQSPQKVHFDNIFCCGFSDEKTYYTYKRIDGTKRRIYVKIKENDIKDDTIVYVVFWNPEFRN